MNARAGRIRSVGHSKPNHNLEREATMKMALLLMSIALLLACAQAWPMDYVEVKAVKGDTVWKYWNQPSVRNATSWTQFKSDFAELQGMENSESAFRRLQAGTWRIPFAQKVLSTDGPTKEQCVSQLATQEELTDRLQSKYDELSGDISALENSLRQALERLESVKPALDSADTVAALNKALRQRQKWLIAAIMILLLALIVAVIVLALLLGTKKNNRIVRFSSTYRNLERRTEEIDQDYEKFVQLAAPYVTKWELPSDIRRQDGGDYVILPVVFAGDENRERQLRVPGIRNPVFPRNINNALRHNKEAQKQLGIVVKKT